VRYIYIDDDDDDDDDDDRKNTAAAGGVRSIARPYHELIQKSNSH